MADWIELEKKYFMRTFKRMPVVLVRGQGARVWDELGNEYLDFTAGWGVNSLGHCLPCRGKVGWLSKAGPFEFNLDGFDLGEAISAVPEILVHNVFMPTTKVRTFLSHGCVYWKR